MLNDKLLRIELVVCCSNYHSYFTLKNYKEIW